MIKRNITTHTKGHQPQNDSAKPLWLDL